MEGQTNFLGRTVGEFGWIRPNLSVSAPEGGGSIQPYLHTGQTIPGSKISNQNKQNSSLRRLFRPATINVGIV